MWSVCVCVVKPIGIENNNNSGIFWDIIEKKYDRHEEKEKMEKRLANWLYIMILLMTEFLFSFTFWLSCQKFCHFYSAMVSSALWLQNPKDYELEFFVILYADDDVCDMWQ